MPRAVSALGRRPRPRVAALAGVALLLVLAALPVDAAARPGLSHGSISPTTGAAGTTFTVQVTYTSTGHAGLGWAPSSVRVWLDGTTTAMAPTDPSDHDYQDGATFQATVRPAAGQHHVLILASDSQLLHRTAPDLDLGTLVVGPAATPSTRPTPTPRDTPSPWPTSTPRATSTPPATPRSTASPTPTRAAAATPATGAVAPVPPAPGGSDASSGPDAVAPADRAPAVTPIPTAALSPAGTPSATTEAVAIAAAGTSAGGPGRRASTSLAALTAALPPLGSPAWVALFTRQLLVAAAGSTMMAMALFSFRRRQQGGDEEPAPRPADPVPPRLGGQVPDAFAPRAPIGPLPGEAAMPRWRRPSLRAARQAKPGTDLRALEGQRLTFAASSATPSRQVERRRLRYRLVRLGDAPDEILGREIGLLDQGDEVELLEQSGVYWRVRTPLGQIGWLHRMTLGEIIPPAAPAAVPSPAPVDPARPPVPTPEGPVGLEPYSEGLAQRFARERFSP